MQKVLSPLYYAREDTRIALPLRRLHAMLVNAAVALGLAPFIGFIAAALGTTVAGWVMLWQLWRGTRPMGDAAAADARLRRAVPRIALACLVMGVVLFARRPRCSRRRSPTGSAATPRSPCSSRSAWRAYAAAVFATGGMRLADLRAAMRRGQAAAAG